VKNVILKQNLDIKIKMILNGFVLFVHDTHHKIKKKSQKMYKNRVGTT
jgi:hypothetical protein